MNINLIHPYVTHLLYFVILTGLAASILTKGEITMITKS